ncbi:MAG: inosine/xanthosine triphosphatase [Chloroflexota bacterium]
MTQIVVASTNPVKIEAVRLGFAQMFPDAKPEVSGMSVASGVSDQPMSDEETLRGARNRAHVAQRARPDADFWVGLEGGVEPRGGALLVFAWMVVLGRAADGSLMNGRARTATFLLPARVAALVLNGMELGDADDRVFDRHNSKQGSGSVGLLTGDRITRTDFYAPAVAMALIPFLNPELTFPE